MKKVLVLILVLFSFQSIAQNNGIGFRLGDPSGITYKRYMGDKALEHDKKYNELTIRGYIK